MYNPDGIHDTAIVRWIGWRKTKKGEYDGDGGTLYHYVNQSREIPVFNTLSFKKKAE